jgi:hypothetical protein
VENLLNSLQYFDNKSVILSNTKKLSTIGHFVTFDRCITQFVSAKMVFRLNFTPGTSMLKNQRPNLIKPYPTFRRQGSAVFSSDQKL